MGKKRAKLKKIGTEPGGTLLFKKAQPFVVPEPQEVSTEFIQLNPPARPLIVFEPRAIQKIYYLVDIAHKEVGWLGLVEEEGDEKQRLYRVVDIFLFHQDVSSTHTTISADSMVEFASKLLEEENGIELCNKIRFWGHSHGEMHVFPSGQDDTQLNEFGNNQAEYFIRGIFNRKGEVRLDVMNWEVGIGFKRVPWAVASGDIARGDEAKELRKALQAEYSEKVEVATVVPTTAKRVFASFSGQSITRFGLGEYHSGGQDMEDYSFFSEEDIKVRDEEPTGPVSLLDNDDDTHEDESE